jgi:hypothetical protein
MADNIIGISKVSLNRDCISFSHIHQKLSKFFRTIVKVATMQLNPNKTASKKHLQWFECTQPDCKRPKLFTTSSDFRKHGQSHSNSRPFVCDYPKCFKSYKQLESLYRHVREKHHQLSSKTTQIYKEPSISLENIQLSTCPTLDLQGNGDINALFEIPMVIKGIDRDWKIRDIWVVEFLERVCSEVDCELVEYSKQVKVNGHSGRIYFEQTTLGDYFKKKKEFPNTYYCQEIPEIQVKEQTHQNSKQQELWTYPSMFANNWYRTIPRDSQIGCFCAMFLGDAGSYGFIHNDKPFGSGWIYLLSGLKRIISFPPSSRSKLENLYHNFENIYFPAKLNEYHLQKIIQCGGIVSYLSPGDFYVIPSGWWHQVTNMTDNTLSLVDMVMTRKYIYNLVQECTNNYSKYPVHLLLSEVIKSILHLLSNGIAITKELLYDIIELQSAIQLFLSIKKSWKNEKIAKKQWLTWQNQLKGYVKPFDFEIT